MTRRKDPSETRTPVDRTTKTPRNHDHPRPLPRGEGRHERRHGRTFRSGGHEPGRDRGHADAARLNRPPQAGRGRRPARSRHRHALHPAHQQRLEGGGRAGRPDRGRGRTGTVERGRGPLAGQSGPAISHPLLPTGSSARRDTPATGRGPVPMHCRGRTASKAYEQRSGHPPSHSPAGGAARLGKPKARLVTARWASPQVLQRLNYKDRRTANYLSTRTAPSTCPLKFSNFRSTGTKGHVSPHRGN